MARSTRRNRGRRGSTRRRALDTEDVNPMNFVSNLSDVMLILAVGIMLALILHWNVEITSQKDSEKDNAVSFSEDELQGMDSIPDSARDMGNIYYDAQTGSYYYVVDEQQ